MILYLDTATDSLSFGLQLMPSDGSSGYECQFPGCGAVLKHLTNFRLHMRRHQGIYQYQCPYCKKGLSATNDIKQHLKTHHTGQWGFHCVNCRHDFDKVHDLKSHLAQNDCGGQK